MKSFIRRHADRIVGVLSGFDRLVFRGTLRRIALVAGMKGFLWKRRVLLKDFGAYVQTVTEEVKEASVAAAKQLGRRVEYLPSSRTNKEDVALKIAERDGVTARPRPQPRGRLRATDNTGAPAARTRV